MATGERSAARPKSEAMELSAEALEALAGTLSERMVDGAAKPETGDDGPRGAVRS